VFDLLRFSSLFSLTLVGFPNPDGFSSRPDTTSYHMDLSWAHFFSLLFASSSGFSRIYFLRLGRLGGPLLRRVSSCVLHCPFLLHWPIGLPMERRFFKSAEVDGLYTCFHPLVSSMLTQRLLSLAPISTLYFECNSLSQPIFLADLPFTTSFSVLHTRFPVSLVRSVLISCVDFSDFRLFFVNQILLILPSGTFF